VHGGNAPARGRAAARSAAQFDCVDVFFFFFCICIAAVPRPPSLPSTQGGELLDALLARGRREAEAAGAGSGPPPPGPYSEGEARAIFRQVVDGVRFMHAQ
jgi:hypothetical protein